MRRPDPRTLLAAAAVVAVGLSAGLAFYLFAGRAASGDTRPTPFAVLLLPALASLLVVQAIPYPSWPKRVLATLIVAALAFLTTLVVLALLGCGHYNVCA